MPPIAVYDRPPVLNYMPTAISEQTKKDVGAFFFKIACAVCFIYIVCCVFYIVSFISIAMSMCVIVCMSQKSILYNYIVCDIYIDLEATDLLLDDLLW